jgi:hypothetical protein
MATSKLQEIALTAKKWVHVWHLMIASYYYDLNVHMVPVASNQTIGSGTLFCKHTSTFPIHNFWSLSVLVLEHKHTYTSVGNHVNFFVVFKQRLVQCICSVCQHFILPFQTQADRNMKTKLPANSNLVICFSLLFWVFFRNLRFSYFPKEIIT